MALDTNFMKKPSRIKSLVLQLVNQLIVEIRKHENHNPLKFRKVSNQTNIYHRKPEPIFSLERQKSTKT